MQSLTSYGSDSDDDAPSTAAAPSAPVAGPSKLPSQPPAKPSAAPPVVNRLKSGASSRAQSPLSGVKLPPPPSASSASPSKHGKQREPSASPPPYARAAPISTAAVAAARVEDERAEQGAAAAASPLPVAGVNLDALAEFGIPPLPTGPCNPSVEAKLANFHALRQTRGLHFNDSLHASKAFRNPRIYAKLVEFVDVDETGTNWSKHVWDPKALGPDAMASRIAELQKIRSEAKASGQLSGTRSSIAFTAPASSASRSRDDGGGGSGGGSKYRERDERDRDRGDREREKDRGGKRSRWDSGKRDRSRSPRRR
ncbi:hypothetical protein JCM5296_007134 [Sporobolomyces johnsonii]